MHCTSTLNLPQILREEESEEGRTKKGERVDFDVEVNRLFLRIQKLNIQSKGI